MTPATLGGFLHYASVVIGATVLIFAALVIAFAFGWSLGGWARSLALAVRALLTRRPRA